MTLIEDHQVTIVDVYEGVKLTSMTNLLVGDHQVAVVDVDGGPEGGKGLDFFKKQIITLYSKHCLKKNHEDKSSHPQSRHFRP